MRAHSRVRIFSYVVDCAYLARVEVHRRPLLEMSHEGSSFAGRPPGWVELKSIKRMKTASEMTSLSPDAIRRKYPDLVVKLSPKRDGMSMENIISIMNGTAKRVARRP